MATHVAWVARSVIRPDLSPLTLEEISSIQGLADEVSAKPGDVVVRAGADATAAFIVLAGEIELLVDEHDRPAAVGMVREGGSFGDIPMLCDLPYPFDAVAVGPASLMKIDRATIPNIMRECPNVAFRWLTNTVRRLEYANRRIAALTVGDLRNRIISVLAEEGATDERNTVPLTQTELAALLGATRQSVNRVIGKLSREGVVRQRYGIVEIVDRPRLLQLAAALTG